MTKEFNGEIKFRSPINKETTHSQEQLSEDAESTITVSIMSDGTGSAEWDIPELDEDAGIGLWFEGNELVDYDGVFELPKELIDFLIKEGYNMEYVED